MTRRGAARKPKAIRLFNSDGVPAAGFNKLVLAWLKQTIKVSEHAEPAAFDVLREEYLQAHLDLIASGVDGWDAHRALLSVLTDMMLGQDLAGQLRSRLSAELINDTGFRRTIDQGVAKNAGENFTNAIVLALADALSFQDEVLVDKGLPAILHPHLTVTKQFSGARYSRDLSLTIESDITIFQRSNPLNAILISGKTRLKEVFHIGTMWKLLFDIASDPGSLQRWGLGRRGQGSLKDMKYVFVTADMIKKDGRNGQGPDVERDEPRNLIAADASFFDYVMVSKQGIPHVSNTLSVAIGREALFHELGCLLDLVEQKFGLAVPRSPAVHRRPATVPSSRT